MADVHNQQKRRAPLGDWQGAGVLLGLAAGAQHGVIPGNRTAAGHALARRRRGAGFAYERDRRRIRALLGLQHEALAPVEVDAAGTGGAIAVVESHGAFEDIGIGGIVRQGRVRPRHAQHIAQLGKEKLIVGAFGRARFLPAGDESGGVGGRVRWVGVHGGGQ